MVYDGEYVDGFSFVYFHQQCGTPQQRKSTRGLKCTIVWEITDALGDYLI